ncbi:RluA family pseudouridine synthase [Patescibacteria group bacterium]|nr:MAG: RluA family pseudouridine synthase [Patescibacteria group bacterium]
MQPEILYEDNHVIVVNKPSGVLVQGDDTMEDCLLEQVKRFIKTRDNKPGNVFLGLVHRLDRNVSGVILFAKTSKGASRLSEQFRLHTAEKIYHAWVAGVPVKKSATLTHFLLKNEQNNKTAVYESEIHGAQYAELHYEIVKTIGDFSLLKIRLETGRPHQIRAQLGYIGHPILGDGKYGSKISLPDKRMALVATSLSFLTATGGEKRTIEVPILEFPPELQ